MPKKPPEPSDPKTGVGPFKVWRNSVAGIGVIERTLRNQLKKLPEDERPPWLMDLYLKVSSEADRKLMTELKARQILQELRDREMLDWTPEQFTTVIENHSRRRGYRNVKRIRERAVTMLVEAGQPEEAARMLVDELIPPVVECEETLGLGVSLNKSYKRIEADMEAGRAELQVALEGDTSSEQDPYGEDGDDQGDQTEAPSDETVKEEGAVH